MKTVSVYCRPYTPCAVLRNGIDPPWIGLTLKKPATTRWLTEGLA